MLCSHCGICCKKTEMLLSNKDIERLENKGYAKEKFVRYEKKGFANCKIIVDTVFSMTGKSIVAKFMSIDLQDAAFTQWYTMKRRE